MHLKGSVDDWLIYNVPKPAQYSVLSSVLTRAKSITILIGYSALFDQSRFTVMPSPAAATHSPAMYINRQLGHQRPLNEGQKSSHSRSGSRRWNVSGIMSSVSEMHCRHTNPSSLVCRHVTHNCCPTHPLTCHVTYVLRHYWRHRDVIATSAGTSLALPRWPRLSRLKDGRRHCKLEIIIIIIISSSSSSSTRTSMMINMPSRKIYDSCHYRINSKKITRHEIVHFSPRRSCIIYKMYSVPIQRKIKGALQRQVAIDVTSLREQRCFQAKIFFLMWNGS